MLPDLAQEGFYLFPFINKMGGKKKIQGNPLGIVQPQKIFCSAYNLIPNTDSYTLTQKFQPPAHGIFLLTSWGFCLKEIITSSFTRLKAEVERAKKLIENSEASFLETIKLAQITSVCLPLWPSLMKPWVKFHIKMLQKKRNTDVPTVWDFKWIDRGCISLVQKVSLLF